MKQCVWCRKVMNIHTQKYEHIGALILPDATHGICPECNEKAQGEIQKRKKKRRKL